MKKPAFIIILLAGIAACQPTPREVPTPWPSSTPVVPTLTVAPTLIPVTAASSPTATQVVLQISPRDGMTQLFVPAGSVQMGGLDVYAENDELPAHIVRLDNFWIDQVEVTNGMYQLCLQAGACNPPAKMSSDNRAAYFDDPAFQDYPVVHVTWLEARDYCAWVERRLPTEAEWERAARGDDLRTYPWGDELPSGLYLNFNNEPGDTTRVGSYTAGASPFGALDMAGNVWEWVNDLYDSDYYQSSPETNPTGPLEIPGSYLRVLRGGSFQDERVNMRVSNRGSELGPNPFVPQKDPAYAGRSSVKIGFRCVADN